MEWNSQPDEIFVDSTIHTATKNGKTFTIIEDNVEGEGHYFSISYVKEERPDLTIHVNEVFETLVEARDKCASIADKIIEV